MSEQLEIPEEFDGERVDKAVAVLCDVSRRIAKATIEAGGATRRGDRLSPSDRVVTGDVIEVDLVVEEAPVVADGDVEFAIAYEDGDVLVVDKPAGVVVHPGAGRSGGTLANGLLARIPEIADLGSEHRWGIVHRIDKDTSGLLIVAKTPTAFDHLQAALKEHAVNRRYLTLVAGRFTNTAGTIDAPVGRDHAHPTRMTVAEGGREARSGHARNRAHPSDPGSHARHRPSDHRRPRLRAGTLDGGGSGSNMAPRRGAHVRAPVGFRADDGARGLAGGSCRVTRWPRSTDQRSSRVMAAECREHVRW